MKFVTVAIIALALTGPLVAQEKSPQLKDTKDKVSYAFGLNVGFNLGRQKIELNEEAFVAGMKDAMSGRKPLMSETEVRDTIIAFNQDLQKKQQETAKKNEAETEKFMGQNKTKDGVKSTASGLQYKVLKEGNGAQPKATDMVTVNYRGTLVDGTEFDSSFKRGEPATFPVGGVIKGWTEALQLMKVGSKYQLFIPPDLGYGATPQGSIPPSSVLIFEVELLDVKPAQSGASGPASSPK